ncbi:MAG: hypothetical protein GX589_04800, partial [Deltaproteobacteria bacterium]|nr:hypothetical protein [Deltaproteobacteria bacterium]
ESKCAADWQGVCRRGLRRRVQARAWRCESVGLRGWESFAAERGSRGGGK